MLLLSLLRQVTHSTYKVSTVSFAIAFFGILLRIFTVPLAGKPRGSVCFGLYTYLNRFQHREALYIIAHLGAHSLLICTWSFDLLWRMRISLHGKINLLVNKMYGPSDLLGMSITLEYEVAN